MNLESYDLKLTVDLYGSQSDQQVSPTAVVLAWTNSGHATADTAVRGLSG